ncbi:hypothetical protein [Moraxella caviae]|nr:hypothetical protein [Moraxella caviae]
MHEAGKKRTLEEQVAYLKSQGKDHQKPTPNGTMTKKKTEFT